MSLRKLIILACLVILPSVASAKENPRIYTIQKGDTLWGISQRFITDPLYWPNLWANNPFIRNPHLIYPGQKVALYDGRLELLPEYQQQVEEESVAAIVQPKEELPVPEEVLTFKAYGDINSFISTEALENAGRIVDTVDDRIMMTQGDEVFIQMADNTAEVGSEYSVFSVGKMITHPQTNEKIGYQVTWRGQTQLTAAHDQVYSGTITRAVGEITRGTILLAIAEQQTTIVLQCAQQPLDGYIIAAHPEKLTFAQHDICYIDKGSDDGLAVGNMLTIVRPRNASNLALQDRNIILPDTLLGRAVVIKTDRSVAAALILKSSEPIHRGDLIYTEMN
ncbi:MAG: LysM peptidoglycan-binding domain-containing protein [Deltaproteobacteria bacterium]|nr:LysM peptidoglycan-binding domain-containing protein [Deltaproteobacteria bacterium]